MSLESLLPGMITYFAYITTNRKRGVLYTGMTNSLMIRTEQHKAKVLKSFTSKYNADKLVWYQEFEWVWEAIAREREIKGWRREKKIKLIESINPQWEDLYYKLLAK